MTPIYCQECGRANSQSARRCIWCATPIVDGGSPASFDTTRVEIDYLDGIERLDNPAPVRLIINSDGVEVSELMPGSRTVRIAPESLVRADAVDASTANQPGRKRLSFWRALITPFNSDGWKRNPIDDTRHDYVLTIRYEEGGEVRNAVFHRQDRAGRSIVEGLARIINMLVRLKSGDSSTDQGQ
ncbi:MAG TPA: hypothetical protein VJZ26_10365 [Blastocatellia bacterium]|nr:hypothetical protein [Blastocatellia bacterium]